MAISTRSNGFLRAVHLVDELISDFDEYPYSIPAIRALTTLPLHPKVTFFVGENGSGKSTLIEAIAIACKFNAEGGSKQFDFATHRSESSLHEALYLVRKPYREKDGFFLRAESFYNVATRVELNDAHRSPLYGGISLHDQSHGESFIALMNNRFKGEGLYILDEPEAALSPMRQLAFLKILNRLVQKQSSQFIIATHSPIIMSYPGARIYNLDTNGISRIAYKDTEHFKITLNFLSDREAYLRHLLSD